MHRFVRLLRLRGVRISTPEALDAMACAREPGMLRDKEQLRAALRVALVKDRRDEEVFDEIFDQFFALVKVGARDAGHGHGHGHEDLSDPGTLSDFTLVRGAERHPAAGPQARQARRHPRLLRPRGPGPAVQPAPGGQQDRPRRDDRRDRAVEGQPGRRRARASGSRSRPTALHNAGMPGEICQQQGTKVDADLSVAQQEALLGWLNEVEGSRRKAPRTTPPRCAAGSPACSPGCPRRSRSTWKR